MKRVILIGALFFSIILIISSGYSASVGEPIIIGVPTALGSIEGVDGWRSVQMAVEEINAKGGESVGGVKRPLKAYSIDTREHEPGIPVHDALTAVENPMLLCWVRSAPKYCWRLWTLSPSINCPTYAQLP